MTARYLLGWLLKATTLPYDARILQETDNRELSSLSVSALHSGWSWLRSRDRIATSRIGREVVDPPHGFPRQRPPPTSFGLHWNQTDFVISTEAAHLAAVAEKLSLYPFRLLANWTRTSANTIKKFGQ